MKPKLFIYIILVVLIQGSALAGPGDFDTTFAGTGKSRVGFKRGNDKWNATVVQPDGRIIAVGSTPNGTDDFLVARYNSNGSLDSTFGRAGMVMTNFGVGDDVAMGVALQSDGKIVVGGYCFGSNNDICLARYNTDGSLDTSFDVDGRVMRSLTVQDDEARAVAIQSDGKIVVVGATRTNNSTFDFMVARFNSNGAVDTQFGSSNGYRMIDIGNGTADYATAVAIQADGKIVAVGTGVPGGSPSYHIITRFTTDGTPDSTWGLLNGISMFRYTDTGDHRANAVAVQSDGKILVAGIADSRWYVGRFTSTGFFDNSFNGNGRIISSIGGTTDEAMSLYTQGGVIYSAGYSSNGARKAFAISAYDLNGGPYTNFNGTGKLIVPMAQDVNSDSEAHGIAITGNGTVVVGSSFNGSNTDATIARLKADGGFESTFGTNGRRYDDPGYRTAIAHGVVVQPDGKVVVAGNTYSDDTASDFSVIRYNVNGSIDGTFGTNGRATIDFGGTQDEGLAVALGADGRIVVAGVRADPTTGKNDYAIARLTAGGTPDTSFNGTGKQIVPVGSGDDRGTGVGVQPDGKIVVGGTVEITSANTDFGVIRLTESGGLDSSFNGSGKSVVPIGQEDDEAYSLKLQPDGKVIVVGTLAIGSNLDMAVLRLTAAGIPDNTFGSLGRQITSLGANPDFALGVTVQSDGKVLVSGYSVGPTGTTAEAVVVRYTAGGIPDSSFDTDGIVKTSMSPTVSAATSINVQSDGKIVIGGGAAFGSQYKFAAARYLSNGLLDEGYGVGGKSVVDIDGGSELAWASAIDGQGRAVLAGDADNLFGVVRLKGDVAPRKAPFDFDGDGKTDVSIVRPTAAEWWVLKSSNNGNFAVQFGAATDTTVPADFTGDGRTDIAFFRPATGQWFVLRSEDNSYFAFPFGTNGDIPVPADYDGDGKADPAVFRPSNGHWYIYRTSDGGTTSAPFGTNGDHPVPADYDGDGKADIAIRRPSNGQWWLNRSTAGVIAYAFGTGTDKTVQGDYTGDGKADVAVYRPSTGEWFVLRSENTSFFSFPFGAPGDVPSPGDYDGDGKTDATVFRPTGSTWYANKSGGGVMSVVFGGSSDQPVPNTFVR